MTEISQVARDKIMQFEQGYNRKKDMYRDLSLQVQQKSKKRELNRNLTLLDENLLLMKNTAINQQINSNDLKFKTSTEKEHQEYLHSIFVFPIIIDQIIHKKAKNFERVLNDVLTEEKIKNIRYDDQEKKRLFNSRTKRIACDA